MKRSLYSMLAVIAFSAVSITAFAQSNTKTVETTVYGDGSYRTEAVQYRIDREPINRWDKSGYFGNRYHIGIYDPTREDYNQYSGEYEGNVSNINHMRYDHYQNLNDHNYNTIRYNNYNSNYDNYRSNNVYRTDRYDNDRYNNRYDNNRYNNNRYDNRYDNNRYNDRYDNDRYHNSNYRSGNTRYNDREILDRHDNRTYEQRRLDNERRERLNNDNRTRRIIYEDTTVERYDDRLNIPVNTWR